MRISDWSSDVCSSDLVGAADLAVLVASRLVGEETLGPVVASGHTRRQLLVDQRCGEEAACGVVRRRATLAIARIEAGFDRRIAATRKTRILGEDAQRTTDRIAADRQSDV